MEIKNVEIVSIDKFFNEEHHTAGNRFKYNCDGYKIKTTAEDIIIGMDNSQRDNENFGYMLIDSLDDSVEEKIEDFIGAKIKRINAYSDECLSILRKHGKNDTFDISMEAMFLCIYTDKGNFKIMAYNTHDGYNYRYAFVRSTWKNLDDEI